MMMREGVIKDVESKIGELSDTTKKQIAGIRKHKMLYFNLLNSVANRMMLERNKKAGNNFYIPAQFSICPMYEENFNENLTAVNMSKGDFYSMVEGVEKEVVATM